MGQVDIVARRDRVRQLISDLGPGVVMDCCGVGPVSLASAISKGEIPARWFLPLFLACRDLSIDIDPDLFKADRKKGSGRPKGI